MFIIGLVGPKQAGKDASAKILKELKKSHGKLAFAGPLKKLCSEVFNISLIQMNDPTLKEKNLKESIILTRANLRQVKNKCIEIVPQMTDEYTMLYNPNKASIGGLENMEIKTPRQLLQVIGTNFIRERIFKDWHVYAAVGEEATKNLTKSGTYCVTDIRFLNEYQFLADQFGQEFECYYVQRPSAEKDLAKATHASEKGVLEIREIIKEENIINNDGSLNDLEKLLNKTIKKVNTKGGKRNVPQEGNVIRSGRFVFKKSGGR